MGKQAITLILIVAAIVSGMGSWSCSSKGYSGPPDSIVVAYPPFEAGALFAIAQDQGFFSQNGLVVTTRRYDTGAGSVDGMLNGEADIALSAEFPLVGKAFQKARIRTIGSIARSEYIYLVGRKDRGIEKAADLKGKRVGTTLGAIPDFFLGRFLELNGMNSRDITRVDLKTAAEVLNAVASGDVDAVATAQPYVNLVQEQLGADAIVWQLQSSQLLYGLFVSTDEWITEHPDLSSGF